MHSSLQIENSRSKEDDKMINLNSEHCSPLMRTNTALVDKLPMEEEKEVTESHFEGNILLYDCAGSKSDTELR